MAAVDNLRNDIIAKLLTISNKDYLDSIYNLISQKTIDYELVTLTEEQILMLQLSEDDIKSGRLISHDQLDDQDLSWLKGL